MAWVIMSRRPPPAPSPSDAEVLDDLSRAGKRLMGFCRTNLFKRLESSGYVFLVSVVHHILRNYIFLHAIENNKPLPIGTLDSLIFNTYHFDNDADSVIDGENDDWLVTPSTFKLVLEKEDFRKWAGCIYVHFAEKYKSRFRWLDTKYFGNGLANDLLADATTLQRLLANFGDWDPKQDAKASALHRVLIELHPNRKVLVFSQFADTVRYLETYLLERGILGMAAATGDTADPTNLAWRFSPVSNEKRDSISAEKELRVLVSTDVLSEGQNLQDCAIVVNYDLPWAIIRLIQRVGRVDRLGQQAHDILCYSFLPADGIERLIKLRSRVQTRLHENAEVVGTDEAFFEGEDLSTVLDLYNEQGGILDDDEDNEVDLSSYAYQIWKNATSEDPSLEKKIMDMPSVVYSTKAYNPKANRPNGVLVYSRTTQGHNELAWIDRNGDIVTESQFEILQAAKCLPDEVGLPRYDMHHKLVHMAVKHITSEVMHVGGQLGRPSGARFRTYERLKGFSDSIKETLFDNASLNQTIEAIYRYPLRQSAVDTLNRQLKSGITDESLAQLVIALRDEDRLCVILEEDERQEPQIICSMGLTRQEGS